MIQDASPTPAHGSDPTHYGDMEVLGERIAELSALNSAATFHLLTLIREFDERGGWACGFRSCTHWLSWRTGLAMGPAREKVRVARALPDLPRISAAIRYLDTWVDDDGMVVVRGRLDPEAGSRLPPTMTSR